MIQDSKVAIIDCIIKKYILIFLFLIIEAEEFYDPQYNETNYTGNHDPRFIKKRDILRDFLKNKDKRHKRNISKMMFNRKLGGTHQKSHKNHKIRPGKCLNKSNSRKNIKLTKTKNFKPPL